MYYLINFTYFYGMIHILWYFLWNISGPVEARKKVPKSQFLKMHLVSISENTSSPIEVQKDVWSMPIVTPTKAKKLLYNSTISSIVQPINIILISNCYYVRQVPYMYVINTTMLLKQNSFIYVCFFP